MEDWKNLVIKITEEEHRRIKTIAAENGISIKQLVLDGIEETKKTKCTSSATIQEDDNE